MCIEAQEMKRMIWHNTVIEVQRNGILLLMSGSLPFDNVMCMEAQEMKQMIWHNTVIEVQRNGILLLMSGSLPFDNVMCMEAQEMKQMIWHNTVIEVQRNGILLLMSGSLPVMKECTTAKVVINISGNVIDSITPDNARTVRGTISIRKFSSHFVREAIKEMISATEVIIFGIIICFFKTVVEGWEK